MKIHALTVSVGYGDFLERGVTRWRAGLASLVVVTSPADGRTAAVARAAGVPVHVTSAFYEDGAYFNKGRAMEEARRFLPPADWHLFIDADVVPHMDWLKRVVSQRPRPGTLHGARRVQEGGEPILDAELAGFFQLFHSTDSRGRAPLERNFVHAGNYDSAFMLRWPPSQQRILELELLHLGEPGRNWCGIGNEEAAEAIRAARRRGRSWRDEVIARRRR